MTEVTAALFGAIVGFVGSFYFSFRLFKHQRQREAASKFREAFAPEAAKCKSKGNFKIKEIVFNAISKHEQAVVLYEPFLEESVLDDFRKAWGKYCELHGFKELGDFMPETGIGAEGYIREMSEQEQRNNTLAHIMGLLEYAPVK